MAVAELQVRIVDRLSLQVRLSLFFAALIVSAPAIVFYSHVDLILVAVVVGVLVPQGVPLWFRYRNRKPCSIRVDERGLFLRGRLVRRRTWIQSVEWAPVGPEAALHHVSVLTRFRRLKLECTSVADARSLVDALRFAPTQRSVSFRHLIRGMTPNRLKVLGIAAGGISALAIAVMMFSGAADRLAYVLGLSRSVGLLLAAALALLFALPIHFHLWRRRFVVDVGLDGIRLRHGARERFYAYAMIERVALSGPKQILFKVRGETLERWFSPESAESFVRHVAEAMQVALAPSAPPPIHLAPAVGEAYRKSSYPKNLLLRVVEDHSIDAPTRASAAKALRFRLEPEERERVREIAATTASVDLRVRFEELAAEPLAEGELVHPIAAESPRCREAQ